MVTLEVQAIGCDDSLHVLQRRARDTATWVKRVGGRPLLFAIACELKVHRKHWDLVLEFLTSRESAGPHRRPIRKPVAARLMPPNPIPSKCRLLIRPLPATFSNLSLFIACARSWKTEVEGVWSKNTGISGGGIGVW